MKRLLVLLLLAAPAYGQQCDPKVIAEPWVHVYHPQRLQVTHAGELGPMGCSVATGTIVDATHGKRKQGCRSEADGDLHCWLKLDPGQERFINEQNIKTQDGNLVWEPMCQHRVTQADAKAACKDWTQKLVIPPIGTHVRITGSAVTDLQHGHKEFHPVWAIDILPSKP